MLPIDGVSLRPLQLFQRFKGGLDMCLESGNIERLHILFGNATWLLKVMIVVGKRPLIPTVDSEAQRVGLRIRTVPPTVAIDF